MGINGTNTDGRLLRQRLTRRRLLQAGAYGLGGAGSALLFGCGSGGDDVAADTGELGPPEVDTIRLPKTLVACQMPMQLAKPFLLEEGFTNVEFPVHPSDYAITSLVADGTLDMHYYFIPMITYAIDHGLPLKMIGGAHSACSQIIATDDVPHLRDIKGKRIAMIVGSVGPEQEGEFAFLYSVLQWIGINPGTDVDIRTIKIAETFTLLGKEVDAIMSYLPWSLSLQDTKQGHVIHDSRTDDPWSQQLCCAFFARSEFVVKYPIATKRALRAILKAIDHTAADSGAAATEYVEDFGGVEYTVDRSFAKVPFGVWRSYDPEDSIRFYGRYLHESGLVKSTPNEIIATGVDMTFFNELRMEMASVPRFGPARAGALDWHCDIDVGQAAAAKRIGEGPRQGRS